jgi:hypothetical protein
MFLFVSKGLAGLAPYSAEPVRAVYEMPQRILADGTVAYPLDEETLIVQLLEARNQGAKEVQLCLWHKEANSEHFLQVKQCAVALGLEVQECDLGVELMQLEHTLPVCLERFHRLEIADDYQWRALAKLKAKDLVSDLSSLGRAYLMRADGRFTEVLSLSSLELDVGDRLGLERHRK